MLKSLPGVIIYILGIPKHKGVKFTKTSDMVKDVCFELNLT